MKRLLKLVSILVISLNLPANLYAKNQQKMSATLCNQTYALCSAARCIPDPRQTGYAICHCEVINGISVGFTSCQKRTPVTNDDNTLRIISTFSFENGTKSSMICPNGTLWTDCIDAPCTVNPENSKKAICSCPIKTKSVMITFGGYCKTSTCNTGFWSGATPETSSFLRNTLEKALKFKPQVAKKCRQQ